MSLQKKKKRENIQVHPSTNPRLEEVADPRLEEAADPRTEEEADLRQAVEVGLRQKEDEFELADPRRAVALGLQLGERRCLLARPSASEEPRTWAGPHQRRSPCPAPRDLQPSGFPYLSPVQSCLWRSWP